MQSKSFRSNEFILRILQQRIKELKDNPKEKDKPNDKMKQRRRRRIRKEEDTSKPKPHPPKKPTPLPKSYQSAPYISPLKGRYTGADIWVIASGPSASFVDCSFFEGKITVGINQVYKRFPNLSYYVRKEGPGMLEAIAAVPSATHIVSTGCKGSVNNRNLITYMELKKKPKNVRFFKHNQCAKALERKHLDALKSDELISSYSSITSGIHFAAFLGAKNIILLGHDCGTLDGSSNIPSYYGKKQKPAQRTRGRYVSWLGKIGSHTVTLKKWLKDVYGCSVYSLNPFVNFDLEGHTYKAS